MVDKIVEIWNGIPHHIPALCMYFGIALLVVTFIGVGVLNFATRVASYVKDNRKQHGR